MLFQYLLIGILQTLNVLFFFLPQVTTLPTIGGYDIDSALVHGVAMFKTYATAVWPVYYVFLGFLFLLAYYSLKMILKFFLGHRAPGTH